MSGLGLGPRWNSFASSSIQNHFLYTQLFSSSWTIPTHTTHTPLYTAHTYNIHIQQTQYIYIPQLFNLVSSLWMCDQEELAYPLSLSFPICDVGMTISPTSQCCGENNVRPTKVLAPRELPRLLQRSILAFIRSHLL